MKTNHPLPKYIQPLRLTERGASLSGVIPIADCSRLQEQLTDTLGEITVDLRFGRDDERFPYIKGVLTGALHLQCQRCLQPMDYALDASVALSPMIGEAGIERLAERYEPLVLEEDQAVLIDVVEDEILLNLPLVPKHEQEQCIKLQKS